MIELVLWLPPCVMPFSVERLSLFQHASDGRVRKQKGMCCMACLRVKIRVYFSNCVRPALAGDD
jgi:hypothetical protein